MVWLDKFKLSKSLARALNEAGYGVPREIQLKTLTRIIGGQDIIAVAPEGSGKTLTLVIAVLNRIKQGFDDAPRVLILAPDKEKVLATIEQFNLINKNNAVKIVGLYVAPGIEAQMDALANGADIVVATPDRARAIYLKLGLNLNKIGLFIVDDAELIVKKGLQLPVAELANSIIKCQHLVFTEVLHDKLKKMIAPFMKLPAVVEIDETGKNTAIAELSDELMMEQESKEQEKPSEKKPAKADKNTPVAGEAFHQKKATNAKTYNYSSGTKAKMNNKRKH